MKGPTDTKAVLTSGEHPSLVPDRGRYRVVGDVRPCLVYKEIWTGHSVASTKRVLLVTGEESDGPDVSPGTGVEEETLSRHNRYPVTPDTSGVV